VPKRENRVAIVGVGYSKVGRRLGLTNKEMTVQSAKAAMEDAGMTPKDIDGVSIMPGVAGPEPPGADQIEAMMAGWMLGMNPLNWFSTAGGPAFVYTALQSIAAIRAGFCHTCIGFRIIQQRLGSGEQASGEGGIARQGQVRGDAQFTAPFGVLNGVQSIGGLLMQRHMAQYGTREEQFGALAVAQREYAALNDDALLRAPITIEDYLNSRYVTKPLRLLDCDYPVDAGSAVIFTTEERARDWKKKPVFVEAYALSSVQDMNFEILADMAQTSPAHCARELWKRTDLKPSDVDCAQLYDGFTIIVFQWLEALGFCKPGEAGPFVEAGNTRLGGRLPVNTDGGACNVGRRHGANFCIEATRQIRSECGPRQVKDAEVAVWANAVGPFSGAVLLTRD
jgi:acetyl-CoA acetyltransferase